MDRLPKTNELEERVEIKKSSNTIDKSNTSNYKPLEKHKPFVPYFCGSLDIGTIYMLNL